MPTVLELLDHAVLHVAALWYHFSLVLQGPPPGGIKATERGEVKAVCSDILKCWLRGEWPWEEGVELVHHVGGSAELPERGVSLEHCRSLQAAQ